MGRQGRAGPAGSSIGGSLSPGKERSSSHGRRRRDPAGPGARRARTTSPAGARRRGRSLARSLAEARPKQWVKNVLVVAAPGRGRGAERAPRPIFDTCVAFVAFCLAASGTYFLNDAFDVEADRLHAKKRFRPIAAGDAPGPHRAGRRGRC